MADQQPGEQRPWWRRLLSVPGVLVMAGLTAIAGYAGTELATSVKDEAARGRPVEIALETNPARSTAFSDLPITGVVPRRALEGAGPRDCADFRPWLLENGGVDAPETKLQVVVQGNIDDAVLISGMRAEIVDTRAPAAGTTVECPPAAEAQLRSVAIDLDSPQPVGRYLRDGRETPFGFTIGRGETETFNVVATARERRYSWRLLLSLVVAGETQEIRIPEDETLLETTPARGRRLHWTGEGWG